jgi:hypothetical protein
MKSRIIKISCLAMLLATPALADTPASLFFTPKEVEKIAALPTGNAPHEDLSPDIHLGAVLYYGPDDWSVWLQGTRWTPGTEHPGLRIIGVSPNRVEMLWTPAAGAPERPVTLRPYQTYQTATGMVVEGLR